MHNLLRAVWLAFLLGLVVHLSHRRDSIGILAVAAMVGASLVAAWVVTNRERH